MIRPAALDDAESITRIYNHYLVNTTISFEEQAVSPREITRRMADVQAAALPWLVCEQDGRIVGYAYAAKWKVRHAYRFSVESTVYLDPEYGGRGLGTELYTELLRQLKGLGLHVVLGVIALPNPASIALHEKVGMKKVAHFSEVGFKFDQWIDVGYWQGLL